VEPFSVFIISLFFLVVVIIGSKKLSEKVNGASLNKESYELGFALKMIRQTETLWGFKLGDPIAYVRSGVKHLGFIIHEKNEFEKMFDFYATIGKSKLECTNNNFSDIESITFLFNRKEFLELISIKTKHNLQENCVLMEQIFGRALSYNDNPIVWLVGNEFNIYVDKESGSEIVYHLRFMDL